MPDVHFGKGATVGSVIAMKGAVSPEQAMENQTDLVEIVAELRQVLCVKG